MLVATREPTLNAAATAQGLIARPISEKRPPASKAAEKRRRLRMILACGVNAAAALRHYSCLATQHPAGLRVHQMRLCARKARHLDVGEVIFLRISAPQARTFSAALAVEGRHDLGFMIFRVWYDERWDRAPMLFCGRPTVSRQNIAFDYSSPAELYLSKRGRRCATTSAQDNPRRRGPDVPRKGLRRTLSHHTHNLLVGTSTCGESFGCVTRQF
jgi:hypothetical protein